MPFGFSYFHFTDKKTGSLDRLNDLARIPQGGAKFPAGPLSFSGQLYKLGEWPQVTRWSLMGMDSVLACREWLTGSFTVSELGSISGLWKTLLCEDAPAALWAFGEMRRIRSSHTFFSGITDHSSRIIRVLLCGSFLVVEVVPHHLWRQLRVTPVWKGCRPHSNTKWGTRWTVTFGFMTRICTMAATQQPADLLLSVFWGCFQQNPEMSCQYRGSTDSQLVWVPEHHAN